MHYVLLLPKATSISTVTMHLILSLSICCMFTFNPGLCLSQQLTISQNPPFIVKTADQEALMDCQQVTTDHNMMYWYHQEGGQGLKLIAYMIRGQDDPFYEGNYKDFYEMGRTKGDKHSTLKVKSLTTQNQGVYFCASSETNTAAYFGAGTILSVLENGQVQSPPEVKIFGPNKQEFKHHNLISLVCVASGFYPEHVRLNWTINGIPRNGLYQNVASKKENDTSFSTSKRLTLTRSEYFNPENEFKCEASFIGNDSGVSYVVRGGQDCGVSKESYTMYINQGKISYIMVLFKSGLYALIVLAIIWRRKVHSGSC